MAGQRPGGVTLVAVIIWILALLYVVGGVLSILTFWIPAIAINLGWGLGFLWNGIVSVVLGIIAFIVSAGLMRGSGVARALMTIWFLISIVGAIFALINQNIWGGVISLVIAFIGILLLYAGRAATFFRS